MKVLTKIVLFLLFILNILLIIYIININQHLHLKLIGKKLFNNQINKEKAINSKLISKYINSLNLYQNKISLEELSKKELKEWEFKKFIYPNFNIYYNVKEKISILFINLLRKAIGKEPLQIGNINYFIDLDKGIFFENFKQYKKAIIYYSKITNKSLPNKIKNNILLHKGFCHAMLGEWREAEKNYSTIIKKNNKSNIAITASILLNYMNIFRKEYNTLQSSKEKKYKTGIKLATLLNFNGAKNILKNLKNIPKSKKSELYYYTGIIYDETGDVNNAIRYYVKSIKVNTKSKFAKLANQKIFINTEKINNSEQIKKLALKFAEQIGDKDLLTAEKISSSFNNKKATDSFKFEKININNDILSNFNTIKDKKKIPRKIIRIKQTTLQKEKEEIKKIVKKVESLINKKVFIITRKNKRIRGILKQGNNTNFVKIETIIGDVEIKKVNVKKIKKVE